jgi:hypothetical protein
MVLTKLDRAPGSHRLKAKGVFVATGALDAASTGLRLIVGSAGGVFLDVPLVGVAQNETVADVWTASASGTKWRMRAKPSVLSVRGVFKAVVKRLSGDRVRFMVVGRDGDYAVTGPELPLTMTLVLDGKRSESGLCGAVSFAGPEPAPICAFDDPGNSLRCR